MDAEMLRLSDEIDLPRIVTLTCTIAEGGRYQYAERWGHLTNEAKDAIARQDRAALQSVIDRVRASRYPHDFSWGPTQQVYLYAPPSDKSYSIENMLLVRQWEFEPSNVLPLMVQKLKGYYKPWEADAVIRACHRYNYPAGDGRPAEPRIDANYRQAYQRALAMLG